MHVSMYTEKILKEVTKQYPAPFKYAASVLTVVFLAKTYPIALSNFFFSHSALLNWLEKKNPDINMNC